MNMMRAKALECISLVGMSIGKDRFREDAHQVLQYMQTLQVVINPLPLPSYALCMGCILSTMLGHHNTETFNKGEYAEKGTASKMTVPEAY